jgi:transcription antitermination factor NusG
MPTSITQEPADNAVERWHVFAVSYKKEMEAQDELSSRGFQTYIPMRYCLRDRLGKKTRMLQPAIAGLVFVRGARKDLLDFRDTSRLKSYLFLKRNVMRDGSVKYVQIRDNDMLNFQKINDVEGAQLTYFKPEELNIAKGSEVKIMDGPFEGITGIVQRLPGKKGEFLVVSLPGVAIAAVSIKPQYIRPITVTAKKSVNVDKDTQALARMAIGLLIGKDYGKIGSRDLIICEIRQMMESLKTCKTFLPNDKAHFFFGFYAARLALEEPTDEPRNELVKLLPKLKANNLLLPTAQLLFYFEDHNEEHLEKADAIIAKWKRGCYTDPQKKVIELRRFVVAAAKDVSANNN